MKEAMVASMAFVASKAGLTILADKPQQQDIEQDSNIMTAAHCT